MKTIIFIITIVTVFFVINNLVKREEMNPYRISDLLELKNALNSSFEIDENNIVIIRFNHNFNELSLGKSSVLYLKPYEIDEIKSEIESISEDKKFINYEFDILQEKLEKIRNSSRKRKFDIDKKALL